MNPKRSTDVKDTRGTLNSSVSLADCSRKFHHIPTLLLPVVDHYPDLPSTYCKSRAIYLHPMFLECSLALMLLLLNNDVHRRVED